MTDPTTPTGRELRPVGRYEWEDIIRRARLSGLITGSGRVGSKGRTTRGGVSGTAFMAVALVWSSHADPDGTNIWPGDATIAVEAEVGIQVAQAVKRKLIDLGLTEKVRSRHRRQRRGDEYRLTLPSDLLDSLEVLSPAALQVAAVDVYERRRGKRGESGGPPTQPGKGSPVDPPHEADEPAVGDPVDPPHEPSDEIHGGSGGPPTDTNGGSGGTHVGGPVARDTDSETATGNRSPDQTDEGVRTAVTVPRASEAANEPDSAIEETTEPPPAGPTPMTRRNRCALHPALAAGNRPDGQARCPLCRAGAPPTPPPDDEHLDDDPEADHARDRVSRNWVSPRNGRRAVAPDVRDQLVADRLATVHPIHPPRTA